MIKRDVGYKAAELIENGMRVGLGTGSTAFYFIERLIQRCQEGLKIQAIASSQKSYIQAKEGKIPLIDAPTTLDITVDGADEIDPQKRMIKGGGGALVRERILASISRELIIIVDQSKLVRQLGHHPLPVEVIPFCSTATLNHIHKLGYKASFRPNFLSDNGNLMIDVHFSHLLSDPEHHHALLRSLPGVVDTGFFFNLAGRIIVGFSDGQILIQS